MFQIRLQLDEDTKKKRNAVFDIRLRASRHLKDWPKSQNFERGKQSKILPYSIPQNRREKERFWQRNVSHPAKSISRKKSKVHY